MIEPTTVSKVKGTITRSDGVEVEFQINHDGTTMQWGGDGVPLGETVDLVTELGAAAFEYLEGEHPRVLGVVRSLDDRPDCNDRCYGEPCVHQAGARDRE